MTKEPAGRVVFFDERGHITFETDGVLAAERPMDRVHIWTDGKTAKIGPMLFPCHADMCIERLLERHPESGNAEIDQVWDDMFDSFRYGQKLSEAWTCHTKFYEPSDFEAFYHGTACDRVLSILEQGIMPLPIGERVWRGFWDRLSGPCLKEVFVTCDFEWAENYAKDAMKALGGEGAVIELDLSGVPQDGFVSDLDYIKTATEYAREYGHLGDVSEVSASLSVWRRIGVSGGIPASMIKAVHLKGPEGWERLDPDEARARLSALAPTP